MKETLKSHGTPDWPGSKVGADPVALNKIEYLVIIDYFSNFWEINRLNKQRYLMPEGINARVSRYYICWHSITIVCYTFVQQLEICN